MKKKFVFELICYIVCGLCALAGLVFLVLSLIGEFGGKSVVELRDFATAGYICFPVGMGLFAICLLFFAKSNDKASEVAARRAARLSQIAEEPKPVETPAE